MAAWQIRPATRPFRLVGKTGARTPQGVRSPFPWGRHYYAGPYSRPPDVREIRLTACATIEDK